MRLTLTWPVRGGKANLGPGGKITVELTGEYVSKGVIFHLL